MADSILTDLGTIPALADNDEMYIVDSSDATDDPAGSSKKVTAKALIDGVAAGKHTIWVPVGAMNPTVTTGCGAHTVSELTAGRPNLKTMAFPDAADSFAQFDIALPKQWNLGVITFSPKWTSSATDTGTATFTFKGVAVGNSDPIDAVFGTPQSVTDAFDSTANDLMTGDESSAITIAGTPGAGDVCFFEVSRDVSEDSMTEDALLVGIFIHFTTTTTTDA